MCCVIDQGAPAGILRVHALVNTYTFVSLSVRVCGCACVSVCVCVYVREREREREISYIVNIRCCQIQLGICCAGDAGWVSLEAQVLEEMRQLQVPAALAQSASLAALSTPPAAEGGADAPRAGASAEVIEVVA
jgi:hypothetical protein